MLVPAGHHAGHAKLRDPRPTCCDLANCDLVRSERGKVMLSVNSIETATSHYIEAALLAVITKSRNEAQVASAKAIWSCMTLNLVTNACAPTSGTGETSRPGEGDAG